jgi:hypothetical protein
MQRKVVGVAAAKILVVTNTLFGNESAYGDTHFE